MKRSLVLLCFLLAFSCFAQFSETAYVLNTGDKEKGVFSPLRLGFSKKMELKSYVLAEPFLPHIILKKQWNKDSSKYVVATQYSLVYPSMFLKIISSDGTGGVLPPDTKVPFIISSINRVLVSAYQISDSVSWFGENKQLHSVYTLGLGVGLGSKFGSSYIPTVDYPVVFQRTNIWSNSTSIDVSMAANFDLEGRWELLSKATFFVTPTKNEVYFSQEIKTLIGYKFSKNTLIKAGGLISLGDYPFGQMNKAYPLVDVVWRW